MAKRDTKTGRRSILCCRNCRKLYRDAKDGKYRCAITDGQVLPNTICEECVDASIAIIIKDLLPEVDAKYYKEIGKKKSNFNSE